LRPWLFLKILQKRGGISLTHVDVYEDSKCWTDKDGILSSEEWLQRSKANKSMELCARKLTAMAMQSDLFMVGEVHGASFLGSWVLRAFRLRVSGKDADFPDVSKCW
jgi:hypothetical protein